MRYLVGAVLVIAGVIGYGAYQDRKVAADAARQSARRDSMLFAQIAKAKAVRDSLYADSLLAASRQRTADAVAGYEAGRSDVRQAPTITRNRTVVHRAPGATNRAP